MNLTSKSEVRAFNATWLDYCGKTKVSARIYSMLQVLKEHISHMKAAEPYLTNAKPSCKVTAVLTVPHTVAEIQAAMQKFHVGCLIQICC